jgi:8-oxo-dGTP pyrophosphatase MutT (NUDIX family)
MILQRESVAATLSAFDRRPAPDDDSLRRAGVCLLVVTDPATGAQAVVLTLRAAGLRAHGGQWALPGGRLDEGETAAEAALRELDEELGVRLPPDRVLGQLDDYTSRSGYAITPVVVWAADLTVELVPSPDEVESAHLVPLDELDVDPELVSIPESPRPVVRVPLMGSFVHAPTGAVLHQFRELVLRGRPTRVADLEQPVFAWR